MTKALIIAGIAAGTLIIGKLVVAAGYYMHVFRRHDDEVLDEIDLAGTHYYPYVKPLYKAIERMRGEPCEKVSIENRSKMRLCGRYYDRGSRTTVLMVHGYHSNPFNNFSVLASVLLDRGYNVFFVHQRTHLDSDGKYISMGQKEQYDILDWIDYIAADEKIRNIIVYGTSMGGATVSYLSDKVTEPKVKMLTVDCGFDTPNDVLKSVPENSARILRAIAEPFLSLICRSVSGTRLRAAASDSLKNAARPVCFIQGGKDTTVFPDNTQRTFSACTSAKKLITVPEAGHTTAMLVGGEKTQNEFLSFMERFID